ncbi:ABC transporter substrate-binding protein [Ktedonosporobacter rubrisoli]|uniref:ABC transporter substrate-binding protein n=1 Tax=Ktedonosporobacter rubrisoli TaxID=2509675 RepID=A0A4P6JTJ4_KTERU|nr:ABC transporter substrate-binding protein [Ktedonosporobacter rubrisoli]QBD78645.1 ABC transporter substrate-binding protein [Ktedonosporobacter rubrisoli]
MRSTKLILFAIIIAILLAGCGGGNAPASSPTSSANTSSKPAATASAITPVPQPAGSTKITFWYGLSGHNGDVVQEVINKYNQSQKKYYVEGVFQSSYDDTLNKFNASLASQDLPNIVQIYDIGTQRMIDTKQIIPIQDLVNRDHLQSLVDDLEPAIRSYYTIGGKLYSMPFNSSTAVMYFDKNAFRDAGLDPNKKIWTYDELLQAAQKLTKKDASGKASRVGVAFYDYAWLFEEEMAVHNQLYAQPDNGRTQRATKYIFNSNPGVQWLELQKKLLSNGTALYYGVNGANTASAALLTGKAAITFDSIASLRTYVDTAKKNGGKVDVGVAYLPRQTSAQGRTIIGGASLWITNKGTKEQQEGAWDFIKFATQKDTQVFWSSNTGYVPIRLSAYDLPEMKEALSKYPQFQVAIDQIRAAPTNYYNAGCVSGNMLAVRNYVQQATDDYLTGHVSSAQTALDTAVKKSNDSLDEYNASNQ